MSEKITPVIGHEEAQAQLARLMVQGKLPHALLFSGPRGIGKSAVAEALVRCLLTGEDAQAVDDGDNLFGDALPPALPERLAYDAHHPAIARIEAGSHGNLKRVEPLADEKKKMSFTTISIDQIREVVDFMHLSTSEKGWRIVVIDPADGMNRNAENALLKVLEEPPHRTLLILLTHQPDKLLPTTRSRCRELKFYPPSRSQIVEILSALGTDITLEQQDWLTQLAPASAGQWQRYLANDADKLYVEWLEVLADNETRGILEFTGRLAKFEPEEWQLAGDLLLCALHRVVLAGREEVSLLPEEKRLFPQLMTHGDAEHWGELWAMAVEWLPLTTSSNYDKKQVLQSLLFQAGNAPTKAA